MQFFFSLPSRRLSYVKIVQGERNEKENAIFLPNFGGRVLTWGRRVPEAADKIAFYRVKVFLFELF